MHDSEVEQTSWKDSGELAGFLSILRAAPSRALLLDYDGTLAPFSCDPERAVAYPGILTALNRIRCETNTRIVIVTGRPAAAIPKLLGLTGIEIWGCHGLERLTAEGACEVTRIDLGVLAALETAYHLIVSQGLSTYAERKIASIAVHWRGRDTLAEHIKRRMLRVWSMIPDRAGLRLTPFDGGIEIRAAQRDKGDAVRMLFREMGPNVAMAYLGDDETDEDAFGALQYRGLNILVREQHRPTLADVWIRPPEELLSFLDTWAEACRSGTQGVASCGNS